ncbi:synaptogyrin isoform X2 [Schistocerca americana]|uniref:synaptogyrin isoform X2 n=1 Tax=Schistocerca americana TaxID=7009 RepID=UPI001F4F1BC0|nr:synaptogyrin isoform X2 [Schistocerca americana]
METGGAYGGGKAGAPFDPIQFVQRPQVILRAACLLFAIIVFGCISSQGYRFDRETKKDVCLYNEDTNACNYGVGIGVIAFLASIGFLVGEFMFEQMSSVKTRKHYVLADLGFSGLWTFLYFVGFCYLTNQWSQSSTPQGGIGVNDVQAAIAFSFFSIFTWAVRGLLTSDSAREVMLHSIPVMKLIQALFLEVLHIPHILSVRMLMGLTRIHHFRLIRQGVQ